MQANSLFGSPNPLAMSKWQPEHQYGLKALLKHFRSKDDFLLRLVTVDETWVHYYEPENKTQSHQWVGPGSPRPKKFKTQPSAGKVMATIFLDAKDVIMLDFLPKRSTKTAVYYANLLDS